MRKFARNIRQYGEKAAQLRQALQSAPEKAAQIRESVMMTASQLQQLRAEVQASLAGLHVDNPERLSESVGQINESELVFSEAGYELVRVDIEYSLVQKIIVQLDKVEDVPQSVLRSLLTANANRKTTSALLSAIIKAEELSAKFNFTSLGYRGLVIHVGMPATVRVCWAAPIEEEERESFAPPPVPTTRPTVAEKVQASLPSFASGGFFEARSFPLKPTEATVGGSTESTSVSMPAIPAPAPLPTPTPLAPTQSQPAEHTSDWRNEALDRFKKMPSVSKYRR